MAEDRERTDDSAGDGRRVPTEASTWRVEFARELAEYYKDRDGVRMIVLGGSASRGEADAYSDLDIIVYWDTIDREFIDSVPLKELECRHAYTTGSGELQLESYYFDGLKADLGHITMKAWNEIVDGVIVKHEAEPGSMHSFEGFLASVPLHGAELVEEWKAKMRDFPPELAVNMIRRHMRLYVPGYLEHQAWERGDLIAYQDGIAKMLRNILGILAGLNRLYCATDEGRWAENLLARMPIQPERTWERMHEILTTDGHRATAMLEELLLEVFELIEKHMPEVDLTRARLGRTLVVESCETPPPLKKRA